MGRRPSHFGEGVLAPSGHAREEAANSNGQKPWPEFAEYGCASCHHTFDPQRKRSAENVHKAGSPSWSPFVDLTTLLPDHPSLDAIKELRATMESRSPDPHKVSQMSETLAKEYGEWLKRPVRNWTTAPTPYANGCKSWREKGAENRHGRLGRRLANWRMPLSAHYRSLNAVEPDAAWAGRCAGWKICCIRRRIGTRRRTMMRMPSSMPCGISTID